MAKVFPTSWCTRGLRRTPLRKPFCQRNFMMNATLFIYSLTRIIFKQIMIITIIYHFKMAAKLPISDSCHFDFGVSLKTTSPKDFFNEIWLIIGDYQCIYITKIKIRNFYSCWILGANPPPPPPP